MEAAILAVGSELLGADRTETNSLTIARVLETWGATVAKKVVVGDDLTAIRHEVGRLAKESDLLVVSGGLGPTSDDVTREAVARASGRELVTDPQLEREIEARFAALGWTMPEVNRRQARRIAGSVALANPVGTAPGIRLELARATLFLFPGVRHELAAMLPLHLEPWLAERAPGSRLESAWLAVACRAESAVEEQIAPIYDELGKDELAILAAAGDVRLRIAVRDAPEAAQRRLAAHSARLRELLGEAIYGEGPDVRLEAVVGDLLRERGATLAVAESCTGGLLAERLTAVPGASDYFLGGIVTYADRLKEELLGIPPATIRQHGAVSEVVVRGMAAGVRERLGADFGIGVSGIAGPGGGRPDKPVGTVHVAVAAPAGEVEHRQLRLPGDRERVRRLASQWALDLLRRHLRATIGEVVR